MAFFSKKKTTQNMYDDLRIQIDERRERWFVFIDKLNTRAEELYLAAIPELNALKESDDDPNKSTYYKVLSGVCGQLDNMRSKACDTQDKEIADFYDYLRHSEITALHPLMRYLDDFRNDCYDRLTEFEQSINTKTDKLRKEKRDDIEDEYAKIIDSFNADKDKFRCSQCGHLLPVERIFFLSVHIPCPACGTQNTLEPGRNARNLQFIAKKLAEKRCEHLLDAYQNEIQNERDLYFKAHNIKLDSIHKNDKEKAIAQEQIEAIHAERKRSIENAPRLYNVYLRALYDEMNRILPEFKEHHEKLYLEQINQTGGIV
jgi:rubrerythrin